ncbi:sporulation integral membrane protein YlbJ [uncultured Tyzzerella sp.]|uniref:sporulation integral membrane protein YlbJ n=1 Tax=uncultured Tyzzerella sp. TaxID=2321398 RepID=UPI002943CDF3|nr:sporulation integral membrane protein YlbJ [uncultured Tyzzerella sp.]
MKYLKNLSYYIIPLLVAFFNILIIIVPSVVISSAQSGLLLWFNKILPSILPFLIGTNILIHLGFIDFLGVLLDPFMKRFFNVSGCGAFALVLGMLSGYPVGAKITASLRENNKLSQVEAQRLISFTNNSGPLFIIGAIGIGMFKNVYIGYLILFIHYISAITVGFLFRFYKKSDAIMVNNNVYFKDALLKLKLARIKSNKTIGQILGESVKSSLETISMVGGFVILFSVISELFKISGIFEKLGTIIFPSFLQPFSNGFFMGIIEITNGINILSSLDGVNGIIITCGLVSFSGLSILAQTSSMIYKSDIKMNVYFISKVLHSIFSILYGIMFIPIFNKLLLNNTASVFKDFNNPSLKYSSINFLLGIVILILLSIFCKYIFKKKINF